MSKVKYRLIRRLFASQTGKRYHLKAISPDVTQITRKLRDHTISFYPHDVIGRHLYTRGDWNRGETEEVLGLVRGLPGFRSGGCVVELGANIGTQTIYFALSGMFSRIIAVEADTANAALLSQNVRQNGLGELVYVADYALGESDGTTTLYRTGEPGGGHSLIESELRRDAVSVEMRTLATVLADTGTRPDDVSFVWSDLEGFDDRALVQVIDVIGPRVPVFIELSPALMGAERWRGVNELIRKHYSAAFIFDGAAKGRRIETRDIPQGADQLELLLVNDRG